MVHPTMMQRKVVGRIRAAYLSVKNVESVYETIVQVLEETHGCIVQNLYRKYTFEMMSYLFGQYQARPPPEHLTDPKRGVIFLNALAMEKTISAIVSHVHKKRNEVPIDIGRNREPAQSNHMQSNNMQTSNFPGRMRTAVDPLATPLDVIIQPHRSIQNFYTRIQDLYPSSPNEGASPLNEDAKMSMRSAAAPRLPQHIPFVVTFDTRDPHDTSERGVHSFGVTMSRIVKVELLSIQGFLRDEDFEEVFLHVVECPYFDPIRLSPGKVEVLRTMEIFSAEQCALVEWQTMTFRISKQRSGASPPYEMKDKSHLVVTVRFEQVSSPIKAMAMPQHGTDVPDSDFEAISSAASNVPNDDDGRPSEETPERTLTLEQATPNDNGIDDANGIDAEPAKTITLPEAIDPHDRVRQAIQRAAAVPMRRSKLRPLDL